jgi:hypothetical protein
MRRIIASLSAVLLLVSAVAFSSTPRLEGPLQIKEEERNPWNHLKLNNNPDDFQFAIVSDRTGGHRAKIFSQAVDQLNLLQPEFVVSVGDLIEGYKDEPEVIEAQWKEFKSYLAKLQMPFFYVVGNHDYGNKTTEKFWQEQFGRTYYHFVYRNVLFLALSAEHADKKVTGRIPDEQVAWAKQVLADNKDVRWTIVLMHRPIWTEAEKSNWLPVEKLLDGRKYTVFAGHIHKYEKFVRQGMNYYQLATTGGDSKVRGVKYGEFDHIVWVTMKPNGPILANLLMSGIFGEDMKQPESDEQGVPVKKKPTHVVTGKVIFNGKPIEDAQVIFHPLPLDPRSRRIDGLTEDDGTFSLTTYAPNDGAWAGDYAVTITARRPATEPGKPMINLLPVRYSNAAISGLKAVVKEGKNEFRFELTN